MSSCHHLLCNTNGAPNSVAACQQQGRTSSSTTNTSHSIPSSANQAQQQHQLQQQASVVAQLPQQLSQLCSANQHHQYPLLALQQNFSHLLPQSFAPQQPTNTNNSNNPPQTNQAQAELQHQLQNRPFGHHSADLLSAAAAAATSNQATHQHHTNHLLHHQHQQHYLHHHHHHHHQRKYHHHHHHHSGGHQNWRKSRQSNSMPASLTTSRRSSAAISIGDGAPQSLLDLSAKIVAQHIPFQSIEQRYEHIPEPVQRRIIFWSFPRHEDDIKMYSSLSTSADSSTAQAIQANQTSRAQAGNSTTLSPSNSNNNNNNNGNNSNNNNNNNRTYPWLAQPEAALLAANNQDQHAQQTNSNSSTSLTKNQNKQLTFHKGLRLYNEGCVHDVLQVGFNLSGLISIRLNTNNQLAPNQSKIRGNHSASSNNINNINPLIAAMNNNLGLNPPAANANANDPAAVDQQNSTNDISSTLTASNNLNDSSMAIKSYRSSATFDRCKITSVSCSCEIQDIFWCEHVVALILYRIRNSETIDLRVPISETLLSLDRQQLQKLVQYIIAEHHTEVLPTAQRLLDQMRQSFSEINQIQGAPDPTAGASANDEHIWHLDEFQVNEKVQNYLNLVCSNSKDAFKQINALFEKIREMFRAKDSNGTRLLKLITEQFLLFATRNEKSRPLWDQLVSLWVIVMLNPDLPKVDKSNFMQALLQWSRVQKCPKEDVERRVVTKRKAAESSDDEDGDDYTSNLYCNDFPLTYNQSNNYPAHMATHRHRTFHSVVSNSAFPVLRSYNQLPILPSTCPCQLSHSVAKKMRSHHVQQNNETYNSLNRSNSSSSIAFKPSSSSSTSSASTTSNSYQQHYHHHHHNQMNGTRNTASGSSSSNLNENRPTGPQEPRSVFYRALDFQEATWDDPHLQLILNKDGPFDYDSSHKSSLFDFTGNPLWDESISQAAARIETLRSHGYRDQALRLTVATVRRLKLHQDQWCLAATSESNNESPCLAKGFENYSEGWIGHPFDPINVMVDLLLDASSTDNNGSSGNNAASINNALCTMNSSRCSCPYNQALADFTHRLLPDLATLSHQHRVDGFPILPLVNLAPRRPSNTSSQSNSDKIPYYHVPVPGCCQKDSYLTLGVEVALIALGQQRSIPTITTAHDRAVRQEAELIAKLEAIDTSDSLLIDILKHQSTLLLDGGPFQNSCCGVPTDSAPLHTYARYLFDSLVLHYPQLAYKVGVYALKMPLLPDESNENFGAARTSPRAINHNHLQSEQLALAQTMLSKAKDDGQQGGCLRKVYRASIKNIRNPASLLKLSKHVLKEAKPSGATLYPALLKTSFDLGLQVLKITLSPHTSNGKTRREAILFIVDCATDIGLEAVLQVMKDSRDYFSAAEALNLVVTSNNEHANLRSQALNKLKLKENRPRELELERRSRDLALDCASRDPTNCALDALKFCQADPESLKKALKIVVDAGTNRALDSSLLIKVADHINEINMTDKAFDIAMVAVDSLSIASNSDNSSSKKDIFSACEYAQKVNGFSTLIPKLINNIGCATVLSEIYHRFSPNILLTPGYRNYTNDVIASYRGSLNYNKEYNNIINSLAPNLNPNMNPEIYKQKVEEYTQKVEEYTQKVEDARWWDALLKRTLKAFVDTTRTRLQNISPRHYGEFIDFLVKAQGTFEKAADGPQQFKDLISEIMKSYRTKKKLMERLKAQFDNSIKDRFINS